MSSAGLPALGQALAPELNPSIPAESHPPLQQWHRLIGQQLPAGDLQLLLPLAPGSRLEVQHPPAIAQPALSRSRWDPLTLLNEHPSAHLRRPTPLANHVIGPPLTAADQVLALGDQAVVQLAGEHRDALRSGVVPEPVAGHADLAAATGAQHAFI